MESSDIRLPVVIEHLEHGCSILVPDFDFRVYGMDYVEGIARAVMGASALYIYYRERNIDVKFETTYESALGLCKKSNEFVTYIALSL